jgi:Ca2+ transporting ATPase
MVSDHVANQMCMWMVLFSPSLTVNIYFEGMCSALLTFLLLCIRLAIDEFLIKKNAWSNTYIKYIISFLIQGVTVIVVAVPEGLPLAVTLALAYAVRQMTTDNNLVRHLDACETMGNATTICSDKTGTLTTNRMTVVQGYFGKDLVKKINADLNIAKNLKQLINESIAINTSYTTVLEVDT